MPEEKDKRFIILPIFLVIDNSVSMETDDRYKHVFDFLPMLVAKIGTSGALKDKVRIEVIAFGSEAKQILGLSEITRLSTWLNEREVEPILPDGGSTSYGEAFKMLKNSIEVGCKQIESEVALGNSKHSVYRPTVFFFTDGEPNDNEKSRLDYHNQLTDSSFRYQPNIICVGFGDATLESLKKYSAGSYKSPTGKYDVGNEKLVLMAKKDNSIEEQLHSIINALINSIVQSLSCDAGDGVSEGGLPEPFGDDIFDEVFEEIYNS